VARFFYFAFDMEDMMVSFPIDGSDRKESARIRLSRVEARDLVAAVTISVCKVEPPEEVGLRLEALMNRILNTLGMKFDICPECGDVSIDGEVVCVTENLSNDYECN
jgi:hypothetical protein